MTCEHCVKAVAKALEGIDGVKSAKVNLKQRSATVNHGEGVTLEALKAAVVGEGYEVL
jgi:copper chaperone CopZ